MFINFEIAVITMASEDYKEFICNRIGPSCGFQIRAKTEEEVMEHAMMHESEAHGMKEGRQEMERKIRSGIKPVSVEVQ